MSSPQHSRARGSRPRRGRALLAAAAVVAAGAGAVVVLAPAGAAPAPDRPAAPAGLGPLAAPGPVAGTPATARDRYVAATGDDRAAGTAAAPWRSVAKACAAVPAGASVRVAAGTFDTGATGCVLREGVGLIGAGTGRTVFTGTAKNLVSLDGTGSPTNRQEVSGFTLKGAGAKGAFVGMRLENVHHLTVRDVAGADFVDGAVSLRDLVDSDVSGLDLRDSARNRDTPGKTLGCSGAALLGPLKRTRIHHSSFADDTGYGIKTDSYDKKLVPFEQVEFDNLTIDVTQNNCSKWNNLGFEMHKVSFRDVHVHHIRTNSVLSLGAFEKTGKIRVDHNVFDLSCQGFRNVYAIETSVNNLEANHNFFSCGLYPVYQNGDRPVAAGFRVHHNLFANQHGPLVINEASGMVDGAVTNNTFLMRGNIRLADFGKKGVQDVAFANNLVLAYGNTRRDTAKLPAGMAVDRNVFVNLDPVGRSASTADPKFATDPKGLTGRKALEAGLAAFVPAASGSAARAGVAAGGAPAPAYLGALAPGQEPFAVGPSAAPPAPPPATPTATPTPGAGPTGSPTPGAGPTGSPTAAPTSGPTSTPTGGPAAVGPRVRALVLVDTRTNRVIGRLRDGAVLDLRRTDRRVTVRALLAAGTVRTVRFEWDGATVATEHYVPYVIAGDQGGTLNPWTPTAGRHTLRVTAERLWDQPATAGPALRVTVRVIR